VEGAYRAVPRLAILPGVLALGVAVGRGRLEEAIPLAVRIVALILAYGAAITSLGLALATWQRRLGRAVALSVAAYLFFAVVCPTVGLMIVRTGPDGLVWIWCSPFFGMYLPMGWVLWRGRWGPGPSPLAKANEMIVWIALITAVAYVLYRATLATFDRSLGRVPDRPDRSTHPRQSRSVGASLEASVPAATRDGCR
jgi:hypothetical protein